MRQLLFAEMLLRQMLDKPESEYLGHFAWIPVFNDDCRTDFAGKPVTAGGKEVSLMAWLAAQKR